MRRRKSNRLVGYDYSQSALYFITSCIHQMECSFGEILDGMMILNPAGQIAEQKFLWLEEQYSYTYLDVFIVMPNHVHAIIEIDRASAGTGRDLSLREDAQPIKIKPLSESFHDHVIRDEQEYFAIRKYIENNPKNWKEDKFFVKGP